MMDGDWKPEPGSVWEWSSTTPRQHVTILVLSITDDLSTRIVYLVIGHYVNYDVVNEIAGTDYAMWRWWIRKGLVRKNLPARV